MRRLVPLLLLMACGGDAVPTASGSVASVGVTPATVSLAVGATQQLTATIKGGTGAVLAGRIVTWTTSAASVATVSAGMVTAVGPGTATITATSESVSGNSVVTVTGAPLFTSLGTILTPQDFAVTSGPVADVTSVQLPDGRVRLYLFAQGQGLRSAVSTTSAGTAFTVEPGVRSNIPTWGQPRIIKLSDGRVRLFYIEGPGVKSAISTDGLTFTDEAGTRIANATLGYTMGAVSIVPISGGGYRAYFSDLETPGGTPGGHFIRSATSSDMLTWTVESGIVLGVGATSGLTESASHPFAVANADGSVTLYYQSQRSSGFGLYRSTSTDGRTFTTAQYTGIDRGGDPDVITLANGTTLMYYGDVINNAGVILVAKLNP